MSMLHEITADAPRNKRKQRKGRGESSGRGKTSGKGNKGAKARSGGPYWKPGHEGGQTAVFRRLPKRGFSNQNFERRFHIVNLSDLERFDNGTTVDSPTLVEPAGPRVTQPVQDPRRRRDHEKGSPSSPGGTANRRARQDHPAGGTAQNLRGEAFEFPSPRRSSSSASSPRRRNQRRRQKARPPLRKGPRQKQKRPKHPKRPRPRRQSRALPPAAISCRTVSNA